MKLGLQPKSLSLRGLEATPSSMMTNQMSSWQQHKELE
uniref:Uncharacterized protein n=1 Tax=Rhizophora mucronata TaxID=61149 RepID=A0A2P2LN81_RHIMU